MKTSSKADVLNIIVDTHTSRKIPFCERMLKSSVFHWTVRKIEDITWALRFFNLSTKVGIWIHIGAGGTDTREGFDYIGEEAMKNLEDSFPGKKFGYLTDATSNINNNLGKEVVRVTDIKEKLGIASNIYTVEELLSDVSKEPIAHEKETTDESLLDRNTQVDDHYHEWTNSLPEDKNLKSQINKSFNEVKGLLSEQDFTPESMWYNLLLVKPSDQKFQSGYWKIDCGFVNHLGIKMDSPLLSINNQPENDSIIFDFNVEERGSKRRCDIHHRFFYALFRRFRSQNKADEEILTSICKCTNLYVLHEAIHKFHGIDFFSVNGVGNFPKTVEEADYQADSIALLLELSRIMANQSSTDSNPLLIIQTLQDLVRLAIETTFSFNPVDKELSAIQVRRANRYLIWFYIYQKLESFKEIHSETREVQKIWDAIYSLIAVKPIIEFSGPAITSNSDKDRVFYRLNNMVHNPELCLFIDNKVIRKEKHNIDNLINGLKKSEFELMMRFFLEFK